MYYLIIKNLDVEKCIDKNKEDIYIENSSYNCEQTITFTKKKFVRNIRIYCSGLPGSAISAKIYSD
jgi:hypothetical protein